MTASAARQARRRRIRRLKRRVGSVLLPLLGPPTLRHLSSSWNVEFLGRENFDAARSERGCIATLWHGRMLIPLRAHANLGLSVLVSPSDDGSLAMQLLDRYGYGIVRGSTSGRATTALREMLARLDAGATIVITPDGPRGPRHSVNQGPAWMARETGFPILPTGMVTDRAWHLSSWDRFTIPKWGARIAIVYGEPIHVPRDSDADALARVTEDMRSRMLAAEEAGFRHLGAESDL